MSRDEHWHNRRLSERLEAEGAVVLRLVAGEMTPPGWPDRYVGHALYHGWVEGKMPDNWLSTPQRLVAKSLLLRRVPVVVMVYEGPDSWLVRHPLTGADIGFVGPDLRAIVQVAACLPKLWEQ